MKVKIIIILIIIIVIIIGCLLFFRIGIHKKKECVPFSGGSFNIIFNTNGGDSIPLMHVGIACSPDSYDDIPIPVKSGFKFDGWYYDSDFNKKVEYENSRDFKVVPLYDKDKCVIGYKDIEIYAKWIEE